MPEPITETMLAEWQESARKSAYFTLTGEMMLAVIAEIRRLRSNHLCPTHGVIESGRCPMCNKLRH